MSIPADSCSRRRFLAGSLAAGAGLSMTSWLEAADEPFKSSQGAGFQQPKLPYELGALAPFLTEEQMNYHYNKHHASYFKNLNGLVEGKPEAKATLRALVVKSEGPVFNNAAQAWNHTFFWHCMTPDAGAKPQGELARAIARDFGSIEEFQSQFSAAAAKLFGSGWAWLAADKDGKLSILALSNAGTPLKEGLEPVLTIDVWEHAYYVDYRTERPRFIENFWKHVNWDFCSQCLAGKKPIG